MKISQIVMLSLFLAFYIMTHELGHWMVADYLGFKPKMNIGFPDLLSLATLSFIHVQCTPTSEHGIVLVSLGGFLNLITLPLFFFLESELKGVFRGVLVMTLFYGFFEATIHLHDMHLRMASAFVLATTLFLYYKIQKTLKQLDMLKVEKTP